MTVEGATSKIKLEIYHFLFYRKSRVGVMVGTLVEPLISNGRIFAEAGENCKVKFKSESVDLSEMGSARIVEINIKKTCEEKYFKGAVVKQFTAESVSNYITENQKTFLSFC